MDYRDHKIINGSHDFYGIASRHAHGFFLEGYIANKIVSHIHLVPKLIDEHFGQLFYALPKSMLKPGIRSRFLKISLLH